jgi:hypothetical protein
VSQINPDGPPLSLPSDGDILAYARCWVEERRILRERILRLQAENERLRRLLAPPHVLKTAFRIVPGETP